MSDKPYILIADDDLVNQLIFEEQLSRNFDVRVVEDGGKCIQALAEKKPDLLLLDINMPVLDGYEVCKAVRQDYNKNELIIIFVSAMASEQEQELGMKAGANGFLTKPYEEEDLFAIIEKHLKLVLNKSN